MLASGHPEARLYPLGLLAFEHRLVIERQNLKNHNHYYHLSLAFSASGNPEAAKAFDQALKALISGD